MAASLLAKPFLGTSSVVAARSGRSTRSVRSVRVSASADRPTWYPGATPPKYLDGSLPGDYGFDPLRFGGSDNKTLLPWYREAELYNGRVAMAAVAGILFTDALGIGGNWWETGANVESPFSNEALVAIEIATFAVLESFRVNNYKTKGETGFLFFAPFDPLGLKSPETQVKEIKNARLAMVAFLGFSSQAAVQGLGPIECLLKHLEDPGHNNIFTSKVGPEATVAVIALSIAPIIIEAKKALSGTDEDEFRPIPF